MEPSGRRTRGHKWKELGSVRVRGVRQVILVRQRDAGNMSCDGAHLKTDSRSAQEENDGSERKKEIYEGSS